MSNDDSGLKFRELTQKIIGVFYEVYNELGHGFIESVYETAFEIALTSSHIPVLRQIEVPVWFRKEDRGFHRRHVSRQVRATRVEGRSRT